MIAAASAADFEAFRLQVLSTFLSHPTNVDPGFAFAMYKRLPPVCNDRDGRLAGFESHFSMPYQRAREVIHYLQTQFIHAAKLHTDATLPSLISRAVYGFPVKACVDFSRYLLIRQTLHQDVQSQLKIMLAPELAPNTTDPATFSASEVQIF